MRRLLVIALVAAPLAASAQFAGQVWFDGSSTSPTINRGECNGSTSRTLALSWATKMIAGTVFPSGGQYRVFASTGDPGNVSPWCYTPGTSGQTVTQVTTDPASPATTSPSSASVTASALAAAAGYDCTTDKVVYVCVAWYAATGDADAAFAGYAKGQVNLKTALPVAPVFVPPVKPGDRALYATVNAGARVSGDVEATGFKVKAVGRSCGTLASCDLKTEHWSDLTPIGAQARIGGLTNVEVYTVSAVAYADDGNASIPTTYAPASDAEVTPTHVRDAWEEYVAAGGRDSGGCDTVPAGLLALLGAAALPMLRRRS